jgi:hypothetical protein
VVNSFQVHAISAPTGNLSLGTVVSDTIAKPGDQHSYVFNATAGQRIYYDSLDRGFGPINVRLVAPSGGIVWDWFNHSNDNGPISLNESGAYTLIVSGSGAGTGTYQFRILDLANAPALSLTAATSGQLNPASSTDMYQLNGKAGQRLNLKSISATSNQAGWRVVSAANQTLASTSLTANLGDVVLPISGPCWVLVEGTADSITPLSYQFSAIDDSDATVAVGGLGDVRSGTLAAGQQDTFTFTAPAGLWVYYDSQDRTATSLLAELKDPTGTLVFSVGAAYDSGPYILAHSGTYTFTLRGNPASATATYRYRLMDWTDAAPTLAFNTPISASLDPYRTDVYQFPGQSGLRLLYDALENDFDNVSVRLVNPDGQVRFANGNSDSDVGPFTLNLPGTYYLVFESNLSTAATYNARLLNIATQPALTFGAPVNVSIDPGLGCVIYQFSSNPGQRLFFDGLTTSASGSWYLFGPNNESLGGTSLTADFEVVTASSGLYVLVLSGNSSSPVGDSFSVYQPAAAAAQPEITSLTVAGTSATVVWNSVAGKVYRPQYVPALGQATWTNVPGDVTATGPTASATDSTLSGSQRFYRIVLLP